MKQKEATPLAKLLWSLIDRDGYMSATFRYVIQGGGAINSVSHDRSLTDFMNQQTKTRLAIRAWDRCESLLVFKHKSDAQLCCDFITKKIGITRHPVRIIPDLDFIKKYLNLYDTSDIIDWSHHVVIPEANIEEAYLWLCEQKNDFSKWRNCFGLDDPRVAVEFKLRFG